MTALYDKRWNHHCCGSCFYYGVEPEEKEMLEKSLPEVTSIVHRCWNIRSSHHGHFLHPSHFEPEGEGCYRFCSVPSRINLFRTSPNQWERTKHPADE